MRFRPVSTCLLLLVSASLLACGADIADVGAGPETQQALEQAPEAMAPAVVDTTHTVEFGAVGIVVVRTEGRIIVHGLMADFSAQEHGIVAGDQVVSVDGMDTSDMTLEQFATLVRGDVGSEVTLEVVRGDGVEAITLERRQLTVGQTDEEYRAQLRRQSEFGGIGAVLGQGEYGVRIRSVEEGLPAQMAGLLAGDEIVSVDGEPVGAEAVWDAIGRIRGETGADVRLDVMGEDRVLRSVTLTRETIVVTPGACGH